MRRQFYLAGALGMCPLALACAAVFFAPVHALGRGGSDWSATAALLVSSADADRDGATSAAEWATFVSSLRFGADLRVERNDLVARLLAPAFDTDGNGTIEVAELSTVHTRWDASGDGVVDALDHTLDAALFEGEKSFAQQLVLRLADATDASAADRPNDGRVSAGEWATFVAAQPQRSGVLLPVAVHGWVGAGLALPSPADRDAFTPDVYLLTLFAELDVDKDGGITLVDLMTLHGQLDLDADGAASATELAPPAAAAAEADSGSANAGAELGVRERYPPADDAQRALPPLAPFQRSLDDALLLVERTGKPLLACVNMDGESASEALAWYLYRDADFARLMNGYVCVLASPDDRQVLDHDDRGRRIEDERFGRVLDQEAIDIEPALYERYFGGTRAAPRHVGIAPDGSILFDVYLVDDLALVAKALAEHAVRPDERPAPAQQLSMAELLGSPEASHRSYLESWFVAAGAEQRRALAAVAFDPTRRVQHAEIVRLALWDPEVAVREEGIRAVAARPGATGEALIQRALDLSGVHSAAADELLRGLRRWEMAENDAADKQTAQRLVAIVAGRRARSTIVDERRWMAALAVAGAPSASTANEGDFDAAVAALRQVDALLAAAPADAELLALRASASLRCARAAELSGQNPLFHYQDAADFAARAGARASATLARAAWQLSDFDGAEAAALSALPRLVGQAESQAAAEVLRQFTNTRARAVLAALAEQGTPDSARIADVLAAHAVLVAHPLATRADRLAQIGFLGSVGALSEQIDAVRAALASDPSDVDLHGWLRALLLERGGAAELRAVEAELVANFGGDPLATWFQGLAEIVAAEHLVRARRPDEALAAYEGCTAAFDAAAARESAYVPSAAYYSALASAGTARLHLQGGRPELAVAAIEEAFRRDGGALDQADGLGHTPRGVAQELRRDLGERGAPAELVRRLDALLGQR